MESFANSDRQYSDGQNNREPIPEEVQTYGFKPPVRLPDGSIEKGDFLSSNHLNYILNDLYSKLASARVVTQKGGDSSEGYTVFSDGTIEMWGRATTLAAGSVNVVFPIPIPSPTRDIQLTTTGETQPVIVLVNQASLTANGFTAYATTGAGAATSRTFHWKAVYHG